MDPVQDTNEPSVMDRLARLERLLDSTMQQVGFLTAVIQDLVTEEPEESAPPSRGVIVPIRR